MQSKNSVLRSDMLGIFHVEWILQKDDQNITFYLAAVLWKYESYYKRVLFNQWGAQEFFFGGGGGMYWDLYLKPTN